MKTNVVSDGRSQSQSQSIPVIDLADFESSNSPSKRLKLSRDLVAACRSVGFVYIINHGVSEDLLAQAFTLSKRLFDLPREEKMQAPHPPGWTHHRGYSWPGLEKVSAALSHEDDQATVAKLREVIDCKVLSNRAPVAICS